MGVFSAFKDKRAKRNNETPTVGEHYTKLGRRSAFIRYAIIILIVIFAIYSLSFHSNEITIENFRYMLKFINVNEEAETPVGTKIAFDGSSGNRGLAFKGDLAVLNESGLAVTGWDSEVILRESFSLDHPKITENGINLFCYDLGGKELRIFNSYSLLSEIQFDYPIYWLAASKSGSFAAVSSAKGYRSAVYVYDKEFRLTYSRLLGDKYVDFVDISHDGEEFVTAAHYSEDGNIVTLATRVRVDSEDAVSQQKFIGEIPLGIYYTENGYCLMTSDKMRMFDGEDNIIGEVSFGDKDLLSGRIYGERILVTYAMEGLSGGTEAIIYRLDGSVEYTHVFENSLSDSVIIGDTLYALSPGTLSECMINGDTILYDIPTSYSSLVSDENKLILFSENQAEVFTKESFYIKSE